MSIHILLCLKSKETLSDNEHCVLKMFEKQEFITRKEVEKTLAVSQAMAVRVLRQLSDKNLIRVMGRGKNTRYSLVNFFNLHNNIKIIYMP